MKLRRPTDFLILEALRQSVDSFPLLWPELSGFGRTLSEITHCI
jgi:hypothetical protein